MSIGINFRQAAGNWGPLSAPAQARSFTILSQYIVYVVCHILCSIPCVLNAASYMLCTVVPYGWCRLRVAIADVFTYVGASALWMRFHVFLESYMFTSNIQHC